MRQWVDKVMKTAVFQSNLKIQKFVDGSIACRELFLLPTFCGMFVKFQHTELS
jgi:hypothetical protein